MDVKSNGLQKASTQNDIIFIIGMYGEPVKFGEYMAFSLN